ncbi:MAG: tetratricopeptide repeat protein [Candidatus Manganitrophaceae bacterium]|nr:MAG: tetratricopeptide repeat protein [Candidatus Manganitrophaceae bacterium]
MFLKDRRLLFGIALLLLFYYFMIPSRKEIALQGRGGPDRSASPSADPSLHPLPPPPLPDPVLPPSATDPQPPLWAALNEKGLSFFNEGRYPEALDLFTQALTLRPGEITLRKNVAQAHAQLGWEAIRQNAFGQAGPHFKAAIERFDGEAAFYFGEALAFHRQDKDADALQSLKTGLTLDPEQAIAHKLLGEIYERRNDFEKAIGAWEKASRLDPQDASLAMRLDKMKREHQLFSHFQQEETRHFSLLFEGRDEKDRARTVIHLLEEAYQEIGRTFSYYPERTILAVLYADQQFRDVTQSPAWTKALFDGKIHLPIGGPIENEALLKKVIYHEFTHALVHQLSRGKTPTWLNEGLALYFEEGGKAERDRLAFPLLPLDGLHGSFMKYDEPTARQAYAESRSATAYLIDRYGFFRIKLLLEELANDTPFPKAFEQILLFSYADFQTEWQKKLGSG